MRRAFKSGIDGLVDLKGGRDNPLELDDRFFCWVPARQIHGAKGRFIDPCLGRKAGEAPTLVGLESPNALYSAFCVSHATRICNIMHMSTRKVQKDAGEFFGKW